MRELAKQRATTSMEMFLRNFSHVPDDKLNWTASPTSKSALRIAAHTALYSARFAAMIRHRSLPVYDSLEEWLNQRDQEELAITQREDIDRIFREGTAEVLAAIDTLTEADLEGSLDSGQGWSMSMKDVINLPGFHAVLHTGQIDFLQTCWDDQQVYVG
ncbi:MAG: DinB family protein [Armatimonadetes bacterium]|nr:DinB family protein [Armatimonadota bacterium]